MVQQLTSPPLLFGHRYPMSLEDYRALGDADGLRIEWVNGEANDPANWPGRCLYPMWRVFCVGGTI